MEIIYEKANHYFCTAIMGEKHFVNLSLSAKSGIFAANSEEKRKRYTTFEAVDSFSYQNRKARDSMMDKGLDGVIIIDAHHTTSMGVSDAVYS